jgi:hypothetical protein
MAFDVRHDVRGAFGIEVSYGDVRAGVGERYRAGTSDARGAPRDERELVVYV